MNEIAEAEARRHVKRLLILVVILIAAVFSGTAGSADRISVSIIEPAPYVFGQTINVTTNAPILDNNRGPWLSIFCYQNGLTVYGINQAVWSSPGPIGPWPFTLSSSSWLSGPANCTLSVWHVVSGLKNTKTDAEINFIVG